MVVVPTPLPGGDLSSQAPTLSIIVTIVDGGDALARCLAGLAAQVGAPPFEVLVPWDTSLGDPAAVVARFPGIRIVDAGTLRTARPVTTAAGQHELYDRRRAIGLAAARGDYVAILEDRGVPRPDWARAIVGLHQRTPAAAIGGAIENGRSETLNWAVFFCDFGRYQPPFEAGPRSYVSDVNVCYRRDALELTRDVWQEAYHEPKVHWALIRQGHRLWLSPEPVVDQHRDALKLGKLLAERRDWGRLFAAIRSSEIGTGRRLALAAGSVALPAVLFARALRDAVTKGRGPVFLRASGSVLVLLLAWSWGEFTGYLRPVR
jgi:hypothetical protein